MADEKSPASRARQKTAQVRAELKAKQQAQARRKRILTQLGVVVGVVVVVVGGTVIGLKIHDAKSVGNGPVETPTGLTADDQLKIGDPSAGVLVGDADAPVTISIVEDFQCPYCQQFEAANADLLASYAQPGSGVKVVYHPIAFLDGSSTTGYSSRALSASMCVLGKAPDKWVAYHSALFGNQPEEGGSGLTDKRLLSLATGVGVPETDVKTCITDETYRSWARKLSKAFTGDSAFQGTPTVLVNGKTVSNPLASGTLAAAVQAAQS